MAEDQWRYQWPDGTWIQWNPRTQTWEKEEPGGETTPVEPATVEAPPSEVGPEPIAETPVAEVDVEEPVVEVEVDQPELSEPVVEEPPTELEVFDEPEVTVSVYEELVDLDPNGSAQPASTGRRMGVAEVLPPSPTEAEARGRLWPTVMAGAAIGVGIGAALSIYIR